MTNSNVSHFPHIIFLSLLLCVMYSWSARLDDSDVHGYHFHVYFYPGSQKSSQEAIVFRDAIQSQIINGKMKDCVVKPPNMGPYGPHLVGNYETCCNKTSIPEALSFFMLNHGNLSVLFHPLTRYERMDHSGREMFLGPRLPMDTSVLSDDLQDYLDLCTSSEQFPSFSFSVGDSEGGSSRKAAPKRPASK